MENNYYDVTTGKQAEFSPLQKMYLELEKIIIPRLLDDFCGYNEETRGFDIILATKEIIEAKEQECEELKHDLQNIQHNCTREGCKYYDDNTYKVFYNCKGKTELSKCKQALKEIEKTINKDDFNSCPIDDSCDCNRGLEKDILDIIHKAKENNE